MQNLANPRSVAIIDDDELVRSSLAKLIRSIGLSTRTFASADEYLGSRDADQFNCLISDIQMPGTTGLQLQTVLKARGSSLPLIMMTAFPDERTRTQALERGAVCFIEKPVQEDSLVACLEAVFGNLDG
jgi:FixJ family two-component response regulator